MVKDLGYRGSVAGTSLLYRGRTVAALWPATAKCGGHGHMIHRDCGGNTDLVRLVLVDNVSAHIRAKYAEMRKLRTPCAGGLASWLGRGAFVAGWSVDDAGHVMVCGGRTSRSSLGEYACTALTGI